jgi:serine/threonine-protein kinase
VKLLQARHAQDRQLVRRFQDEGRRAAALRHPGIIEVHDVGVLDDGSPYQVMDFLGGISLGEELRQHRQLPIGRAVALTVQILDALAVAHAAGIIHRDIKPENLFLERDSRGEQVKILDFGIAKVLDAQRDPNAMPMTAAGRPLGTPFYMPPEQAIDPSRVDARADVYAIGATLFEMLAGRTVVLPQEIVVVLGHVVAGDIERHPRVHRNEVPVWLDEIVARALAQRPEHRFGNAAEMLAALRDGQRAAAKRQSLAPPLTSPGEDDDAVTRIAGEREPRTLSGETPTQQDPALAKARTQPAPPTLAPASSGAMPRMPSSTSPPPIQLPASAAMPAQVSPAMVSGAIARIARNDSTAPSMMLAEVAAYIASSLGPSRTIAFRSTDRVSSTSAAGSSTRLATGL